MSSKTKSKNGLQPKLRFPTFRNEANWEEKSIGDKDFASIYKGKGISKSDIVHDGKTPCIRYGELYTHYGEVIDEVISKTNCSKAVLFLSQKNDVIIPSSGETKIDIATASCVTLDNVALGGDLNVIRSRHNGIFISYYLNGPLKRQIAKLAQGDSVVHLYPSQLEKIKIYVPQSQEQEKIANCLSSLDELIEAEGQKLGALKNHKKSLMQELFPAEGKTLPPRRFPKFQNAPDWKIMELGSISKIVRGGSPRPINDYLTNDVNSLNWLKIADVNKESKYVTRTKERVISSALNKSREVSPGDLIMSNSMSFGRPYILKIKACIHDGWIAITEVSKNVSLDYLYYFILSNSSQSYFLRSAAGSGVKNLNADIIKLLNVALPRLPEQQAVAGFISSIDDLITAQNQKVDALRDHKKGLIQQLFPAVVEVQE